MGFRHLTSEEKGQEGSVKPPFQMTIRGGKKPFDLLYTRRWKGQEGTSFSGGRKKNKEDRGGEEGNKGKRKKR